MTKLNDIESKLTKLVTDNQNEINDYEVKIRNADKAIQDANSTLRDAETNVNVDGYNKAKNNIWSAKHAKELYEKAKNKTETTPLIDRKQYKSLLAEIKDASDNEQEKLNKKAVSLIAEIHKLSDESGSITNKANELMNNLQRNIYREPKGKLDKGDGTTGWSSDETYKESISVNGFYIRNIKGTPLSKLAGEELEQNRDYYWGE